jgi:hypothetical protein
LRRKFIAVSAYIKNLGTQDWFNMCESKKDNVILYLNDSKDSTKRLLDSSITFSKIAGYKINIIKKKSVAFLYTNNEQAEEETRKTVLFTITSKENLILRNKPN